MASFVDPKKQHKHNGVWLASQIQLWIRNIVRSLAGTLQALNKIGVLWAEFLSLQEDCRSPIWQIT